MSKTVVLILVTIWALSATTAWIYEYHQHQKMLELAESEHDRRRIEEQFFEEFLTMRGVIIEDPHTHPPIGEPVEELPKHHVDH